jgi:hypothetical protein
MGHAAEFLQEWTANYLRSMGLPADLPYTLVTFATNCVTTHTTLARAGTVIDKNCGGTNMAGVAIPLEKFLSTTDGDTLIILVSDGELYDSTVASEKIKDVVSRCSNPRTTILAIRWGDSGDTRAMSWLLKINSPSAEMITVRQNISYDDFSRKCTEALSPLMNTQRICIDGASKLPGGSPTEMTYSNQGQSVLVFVQPDQTNLLVNGEEIHIIHSEGMVPKDLVDEYLRNLLKDIRVRIIDALGITPEIAQVIEDLLALIESGSGHPTDIVNETSEEPHESTVSKMRLQKLKERLQAKVQIQPCEETYTNPAEELKQLLKTVELKSLNSSQLNLLFQGRQINSHSKGLLKRGQTGDELQDALFNELPAFATALREYIKRGDVAEEDVMCSLTHETARGALEFLGDLTPSLLGVLTPEDVFEILAGLPGLTFRAKKTDAADPWTGIKIETVHTVSIYISAMGLVESRKFNKSQGGDGDVLCPTMGPDAIITGTLPLPSTCGKELYDIIRKHAPSIQNILAGFSIRGIVASVPGDQAALVCHVMLELFSMFHDPKKTTSLVKKHYMECRSLYTSKYFSTLVDAILKHGLAGATSANGASPVKIIAGMHFGVDLDENMNLVTPSGLSEADQLLLRQIAYITEAAGNFRKKIQGESRQLPTRPDRLNQRDGYTADLCFPNLKLNVGEPFTEDPACPTVKVPTESDLSKISWLPSTEMYLSMKGEEFKISNAADEPNGTGEEVEIETVTDEPNGTGEEVEIETVTDEPNGTGEPLFVLIMRAITAVSEKALAEQPPPGEGTIAWAMQFPQAIVETLYAKAIADKRQAEKEITLNALAVELSTMPCDEDFYTTMCDKCPTRANPLFEKLFKLLTNTTDTPTDVRPKLWAMLTGHDETTAEAVLFDGKLGNNWLRIFNTYLLTLGVTQEAIDTARDDWGELYPRARINRHGHSCEVPSFHALTNGAAKSAEHYCELFPLLADKYRQEHRLCCGYSVKTDNRRKKYLEIIRAVSLSVGTREEVEKLVAEEGI